MSRRETKVLVFLVLDSWIAVFGAVAVILLLKGS